MSLRPERADGEVRFERSPTFVAVGGHDAPRKCRRGGSASRDESDYDVGGVAVEVRSSPVVDGCSAWVGVAGGDLDVSEWDAGVEGESPLLAESLLSSFIVGEQRTPGPSAGVLGQ